MNTPYERTIRFADVDSAGVVYFANYLSICHEAYEASVAAAGLELGALFARERIVIPVSKCQAQFLGPLQTGERVRVEITPTATGPDSFTLNYRLSNVSAGVRLVAVATTEHVALKMGSMERKALPAAFVQWLNAKGN